MSAFDSSLHPSPSRGQSLAFTGIASERTAPILLAPLAGVSDYPFRMICSEQGADLTYVEMLSATALNYGNKKTFEMMARHADETRLGVQVTGRSAEEVADAVAVLARESFETIDINMGCPVRKVVQGGCGSAILRDPERVHRTVRLAKEAAQGKSVSAKIRLGWSREELNYLEIAQACAEGGADWICVHGRTRSESYADPVDLEAIRQLKASVSVPVIGNGNVLGADHAQMMLKATAADGLMVSRGALGNPWIFREIKSAEAVIVSLEEWRTIVRRHFALQREAYGDSQRAIVCMRKHLVWYLKGWPDGKIFKDRAMSLPSIDAALRFIDEACEHFLSLGCQERMGSERDFNGDFAWDPKYDMDRAFDRDVISDAESRQHEAH